MLNPIKGAVNDAQAVGEVLIGKAEQAGEKLAASAEIDLAELGKALLAAGAGYKVVFSVSIEKK